MRLFMWPAEWPIWTSGALDLILSLVHLRYEANLLALLFRYNVFIVIVMLLASIGRSCWKKLVQGTNRIVLNLICNQLLVMIHVRKT